MVGILADQSMQSRLVRKFGSRFLEMQGHYGTALLDRGGFDCKLTLPVGFPADAVALRRAGAPRRDFHLIGNDE